MYPTPSRGRFRQEEEKEGRVKGRERNNLAVEVTDGEVSTEGSKCLGLYWFPFLEWTIYIRPRSIPKYIIVKQGDYRKNTRKLNINNAIDRRTLVAVTPAFPIFLLEFSPFSRWKAAESDPG